MNRSMYFSKLSLKRSTVSYGYWFQLLNNYGYKVHKLIWDLFSRDKNQKRNFIYSSDSMQPWPLFYAVSDVEPYDDKRIWIIHTKPYNPQLYNGLRLHFLLKVNPVVTKSVDGHKHSRHDIIMHAKTQFKRKGIAKDQWPPLVEIMHKEGILWLTARSEKRGFAINGDELSVTDYRVHRFYKKGFEKPILLSSLTFRGLLTVTDKQIFLDSLFYGIGPAKGFGFGMLMIKR